MKIAIIGAGFTGLSAAYYLQKKGHKVVIYERAEEPGGLAIGYKEKGWDWTLEEHYHHWFTNDKDVLSLASEISHKVLTKRPKTSSFVDGGVYQLDSPVSLLKFPKLSIIDRLRTGFSIALLRYNPFWKFLEHFRAETYLVNSMGKGAFERIWEPLLVNKLGKYSKTVSLAWFWARVYKRTPSLSYPQGGFLEFSKHLEMVIKKGGGEFHYKTEVYDIDSKDTPSVSYKDNTGLKRKDKFDAIVVTVPMFAFAKMTPTLPKPYLSKYTNLIGIGAVNIVLRLKKPFFNDGTYWLNMCDKKSPILAIVEHTNFMSAKNYNNEHLLYIGNYMETSDYRFGMNLNDLLKLYDPWLKKINPNYRKDLISYKLFKAPFAQPIIPRNYSKNVPPMETPLQNVFLANIQQVYPWDRGTNYAVELGRKVADLVVNEI